jgi:DNA-binding response OmpR family regulator
MLDIIDYILTGGGYETRLAASAEAAWPLVKAERFDLIVCDIMLPRSSGLSFCRRVRELDQTPVCFLSALGTAEERVAGLEAGADDYIVKPFNARELLMRLQAILRRYHAGAAGPAVVNGPLQLWPQSNQAVVGRRRVLVSDSEMRLLRALAAARGRPVAWRELVALAWLTDAPETGQAMLKTAVHRLRAKLGDHSPPLIVAVRGKGYVMPDLG